MNPGLFNESIRRARAALLSRRVRLPNTRDAQGREHAPRGDAEGGRYVSGGAGAAAGGDKGDGADGGKDGKGKKLPDDPRFAGTDYRDMADFRAQAAKVTPERISEICHSEQKGLIPAHEGLAVVMSNPVFRDALGREMRFDSQFLPKYLYGHGRAMNEADILRFRRVRDGIYAVRHDTSPAIVFRGRRLKNPPYPYGSQRAYSTDTENGETWAISWANQVYIRSIQERPKNEPPYAT